MGVKGSGKRNGDFKYSLYKRSKVSGDVRPVADENNLKTVLGEANPAVSWWAVVILDKPNLKVAARELRIGVPVRLAHSFKNELFIRRNW